MKDVDMDRDGETDEPGAGGIAVVGMSGRFPGARDVEAFWRNLRDGVCSITFWSDEELAAAGVSPAELADPRYVRAGAVVGGAEDFDARLFGLSPREAEVMDPQQRLFLEHAWAALEDAGCDPERHRGWIGVYAGSSLGGYLWTHVARSAEALAAVGTFQAMISNDKDYLATQTSYRLNLRGPSVAVQTACSTSLVAVHLACQGLVSGECDLALAGGVAVSVPEVRGYRYQEKGIASPDGFCRPFDARAAGTVSGHGVGVVVLKRLGDALAGGDRVLAVIKGSAINNDGAAKVGYTAPSVAGQAEVIAAAHAVAGVAPETIGYIEAHGTATALGDPIEFAALTEAFGEAGGRRAFCALASVKGNVGHLDAAAGVTGLIKAVLALDRGELPASLHYERPNPEIDLAASPFYVNAERRPWPRGEEPRRAGVSSFGIGGTNAHVVLEEAPRLPALPPSRRTRQLLPLSARSETALSSMAGRLADHLRAHPGIDLADAAYTLQVGRRQLERRRAIVARDLGQAAARLDAARASLGAAGEPPAERPAVAFVFSGQGAQYPGMGAGLYREEPVFRAAVDECCTLLGEPLGGEVQRWLVEESDGERGEDALRETRFAQPALFVCEHALARLWTSWGIAPAAVAGHSVGEYAAACLAGVLPLADALDLVALRGRLMQALPPGAMLAVGLSEEEVAPRLLRHRDTELAAINGPAQCVVSGPEPAVAALAAELAAAGVAVRSLRTSHAFHSAMMDPALPELRRALERAPLEPPSIPYVSGATGEWAGEEIADPDYWVRQARRPVRFAAALERLLDEPGRVILEVGPRQGLRRLAGEVAERRREPAIPRVVAGFRGSRPAAGKEKALDKEKEREEARSAGEGEQVLEALGQLWMHGVEVDWAAFQGGPRQKVSLPAYPFERQRYCVEVLDLGEPAALAGARRPLAGWFHLPSWRRTLPPRGERVAESGGRHRCLILVDAGGLGEALAATLRARGWEVAVAVEGEGWEDLGGGRFRVRPGDLGDLEKLWEATSPDRVLHLWNATGEPADRKDDLEGLGRALERSFYSLFHLGQILARRPPSAPVALLVAADRLHAVESGDRPRPEKAPLLGLCRVLPQEIDGLRCRSVDVEIGSGAGMARAVERLLAELDALGGPEDGDGEEATVAWRGPYRCVPRWEEIELAEAGEDGSGLRPRGVYVVTGGLGGLGLEIARLLAEAARARLVLVGRSAFPAPGGWDGWLAEHGPEDATSRRISRLRELEALGADVMVASGDVASEDEMTALAARVRETFGSVDGVFHAAGVPGGGLLATRTREQAAAVLAPKVQGTLAVARAFPEAGLLVLCSSLAALAGGIGQADYAAANAFEDAFAAAALARGGRRTLSIAWDAWREVGMAAAAEIPAELREGRERGPAEAIAPPEGRAALARILAAGAAVAEAGPAQVAVSTHDLAERLRDAARLRLSAALAEGAAAAPARSRHPRPAWAPSYEAPATRLEAGLAELWQELLGVEPIGRHDDFFDLGGHSLLALQLASRIRSRLGAELPVHAVVAGATPARLARAIEKDRGDKAEAPPPPHAGKLVALQPDGPRLPFFCVHPAGGSTFSYLDLVERLGPAQPLYAFESDGLEVPFVEGMTLERMAASYVAAIRAARPAGPYHLGGWSMGGLVAYEMARQLAAAGEEVGLLILFDTRADTRPEGFDELPEDEAELLYILYVDELELSRERMRELSRGELLAYVVEQGKKSGHLAADFGADEARRLMDVYMRNRRLMWNYTPRPYRGSMVLFQARDRRPDDQQPLGLRWEPLVAGGVTTHLMPGDHNHLLLPPFVDAIAERLTELFAGYEARATISTSRTGA